jgi:GTPase SAR1 family protein
MTFSILLQWLPEVIHFCEKIPLILVGMKIDLRKNEKRISDLNAIGHNLISYEEVSWLSEQCDFI